MNIFIDSNVFLSLYHFSSDNLEELNKLVILLKRGKLVLFLPHQVIDEFHRNRENKIEDAMKNFNEQRLDFKFPQICKDYPEFEALRELQRTYSQRHSELKDKLDKDIQTKKLKADQLFDALIKNSKIIIITEDIYSKADTRMHIGNPPGKKGSFGDAINWEALLKEIPKNEDIFFISDDKDYESPLDKNSFNNFLLNEWSDFKKSRIIYYRNLSSFFIENYPDITLDFEPEKDELIHSLSASPSFAVTHAIIGELEKFSDFTDEQADSLISAAFRNNQISWIISDPDIHEFYGNLYESKKKELDTQSVEMLELLLGENQPALPKEPPDWEEEIPF